MENFIFCAMWCKLNIMSHTEGEISMYALIKNAFIIVDFKHAFGFSVNANEF